MAIFSTTSSTTTGGWTTFSYVMPPPPPPPYHGSYLPAVIHVFDYEVDLETAGVAALEKAVAALEQEGSRLNQLGNQACMSLEKHIADRIARMRELGAKYQLLQSLIKDEEEKRRQQAQDEQDIADGVVPPPAQEPEPAAPAEDEKPKKSRLSEEHVSANERAEAAMNDRQERFKKASPKVRALHRKVMQLTHENKHGKNAQLHEIYELANAARANNDEQALKGILQLAQQYHSSQGKLAIINFLKTRRQALKNHYRELETAVYNVKHSPTVQVHNLLAEGNQDAALSLFTDLVDRNMMSYIQAIQKAEMHYSALTGKFSDGTTHATFEF